MSLESAPLLTGHGRRCALALGQASMAVLAVVALRAAGISDHDGWHRPQVTLSQLAVSRRLPEPRRQELPLG